jgi:hypothetical protein
MLSFDDAVKLCDALNRSRIAHESPILHALLVRNLARSFRELLFTYDDQRGYHVTHPRDALEENSHG